MKLIRAKSLTSVLFLILCALVCLTSDTVQAQAPWRLQMEVGGGYTFSGTFTDRDEQPSSNGGALALSVLAGYQALSQLLVHVSVWGSLSPDATADIDAAHDKTKAFLGLYSLMAGVTWTSRSGLYLGFALGPSYLQAADLDEGGIRSPFGAAYMLRLGYVHALGPRWLLGAGAVVVAAGDQGLWQQHGWLGGHVSGILTLGVRLGAKDGPAEEARHRAALPASHEGMRIAGTNAIRQSQD